MVGMKGRSLLSKVVSLVTLAYFGIGVVTLGTFAFLYRSALLEDRAALLGRCATRGRASFLRHFAGASAPVSSASLGLHDLGGPAVLAFAYTGGDILGLGDDHRVHAVTKSDPVAGRRVASFLAGPMNRLAVRRGSELIRMEKVFIRKGDERPVAALYFAVNLRDIDRRVITFSTISLAAALVAILLLGLASVFYLRSSFLRPLAVIIEADNAGRRGDGQSALIPEEKIPPDELGVIMISRNRLLRRERAFRESLDKKAEELSRQREALRSWGRELEKLVKRKSDQLVRARSELFDQEKLAELGRLAANVAHEINNPLASIAGYVEELREITAEIPFDSTDELAHLPEALRIIEEQAFRCKDILKRLLDFSRSDQLAIGEIDVGDIVRETVLLTEPRARRRGVFLAVKAPAGGGPLVESDANSVTQIVINLLENAIDAANAAQRGESDGHVEVSVNTRTGASQEEEAIVVRVSDNGYGVPREERERIFDEFYTTKPVGRGTGLGLAICRSMTEHLGGRIEVESLDGQGAAFSIVIPRRFSGVGRGLGAFQLDDTRLGRETGLRQG